MENTNEATVAQLQIQLEALQKKVNRLENNFSPSGRWLLYAIRRKIPKARILFQKCLE
ncbi:MAG: hypothetical protein H6Q19_2031 [Bacteroidetes bacterium]|nr:hypothetical protein [Bacteroidota bacterium]